MLRSLPNRRAPSGLEARVLAEISRRAALPWWRKSFSHWPSAIRFSFLGLSVIAAALLVTGFVMFGKSAGAHVLSGGVANAQGWFFLARDLAISARDRVGSLVSSVPALWLYGGLAAVGTSFVTLAAFGAATYRVLWTEPSHS